MNHLGQEAVFRSAGRMPAQRCASEHWRSLRHDYASLR